MCILSIGLTGAGNFGSVMRGIYKRGGQRIPVAIKTLKQDDVPNAEVIFLPMFSHEVCCTAVHVAPSSQRCFGPVYIERFGCLPLCASLGFIDMCAY